MPEKVMVSVIIPFYSGKQWLVEALNSVLNQSYSDFEVLVINDGSMEDISNIIKKYEDKVMFFYKKNGGPASARNLGIELSKGKYIAFLDSDDIWLKDKLQMQTDFMEKNNAIWSQHPYEMFWENSDKIKKIDTSVYKGNVLKDCYISFKIQTSCVMVKREVLISEQIKFPENIRFGEDGVFYAKLANKYELFSMDNVYSRFRIRGSNAGFNAIIQIENKADVWKVIKNDNSLKNQLPIVVKTSFKICNALSKMIKKFNIKNKLIGKILYLFPWSLLKIYAKKC